MYLLYINMISDMRQLQTSLHLYQLCSDLSWFNRLYIFIIYHYLVFIIYQYDFRYASVLASQTSLHPYQLCSDYFSITVSCNIYSLLLFILINYLKNYSKNLSYQLYSDYFFITVSPNRYSFLFFSCQIDLVKLIIIKKEIGNLCF